MRQRIREDETGVAEGDSKLFTVVASAIGGEDQGAFVLHNITKHMLQPLLQLRNAGILNFVVTDAAGNERYKVR